MSTPAMLKAVVQVSSFKPHGAPGICLWARVSASVRGSSTRGAHSQKVVGETGFVLEAAGGLECLCLQASLLETSKPQARAQPE